MTTIKELKNAKQFFKDNPQAKARIAWNNTVDAKGYRRWFISCLNAKINRNEVSRGRKDNSTYHSELKRISQRINNNVVVRRYELNFDAKIQARLEARFFIDCY